MNYSVYIFGELSSGYTQYPEDSSSEMLNALYSHCKAPTQIAIHRDGSMMYYCYIRKLNGSKYIGLSIIVNGYYVSALGKLFSLFENAIEKMARQGVFIHFADDGTLTTDLSALKFETEEAETLIDSIKRNFEESAGVPQVLPRTDYAIAKDSIKEFCVTDAKTAIIKASYTYGFTYIYKQKDFDTVRMNSYRSILKKVNDENNELKEKNAALQEENKDILSQKKQYRNIVILCLLVAACGVGIYFLYDNLNTTQSNLNDLQKQLNQAKVEIEQKTEQLAQANESIAEQETVIAMRNDTISSLTERCKNLQAQYEEKTAAFDNYREVIEGCQPFLVQSSSFNFNTGYFKFNYYGLTEGYRNITVCVISPDNKSKTYSNSFYVSKGSNSYSFYISRYFDNSKYYTFELLYNGKVIGGVRQ